MSMRCRLPAGTMIAKSFWNKMFVVANFSFKSTTIRLASCNLHGFHTNQTVERSKRVSTTLNSCIWTRVRSKVANPKSTAGDTTAPKNPNCDTKNMFPRECVCSSEDCSKQLESMGEVHPFRGPEPATGNGVECWK